MKKRKYKKRRPKIGNRQLLWRILIVVSLLLNSLQLYGRIGRYIASRPAIQRWSIFVMYDGIKYRVRKYITE